MLLPSIAIRQSRGKMFLKVARVDVWFKYLMCVDTIKCADLIENQYQGYRCFLSPVTLYIPVYAALLTDF